MAIDSPALLLLGLLMVIVGIWLIRWAMRNNMQPAIRDATVEATLDALEKRGRGNPTAGSEKRKASVASYGVRNSASQLAGVAGFILLMAGLLLSAIAVFGT